MIPAAHVLFSVQLLVHEITLPDVHVVPVQEEKVIVVMLPGSTSEAGGVVYVKFEVTKESALVI